MWKSLSNSGKIGPTSTNRVICNVRGVVSMRFISPKFSDEDYVEDMSLST